MSKFKTIYVRTCKNSRVYSLISTLKGDSFRVSKGLDELQTCGWFLKHTVTQPLTANVHITTAIMKSTKKVKHCILYDLKNYTCKKCCYNIQENNK